MARHAWLAVCVAVGLGAALLAAPPNQPQVPFRTGVVLVPLDVRVIDQQGQPVTGLTAADFTVREDRVPQQIAHFAARSLTAAGANREIDRGNPLAADANGPRTFVIVLGRGQLNTTVTALDALIDFVRGRMLPDDRLGVIAYLRASELTTKHQAIVRFLEHYRSRHERLEAEIGAVRNINRDILPNETRWAIDALFTWPDLPRFRNLPDAGGSARRAYDDLRTLDRAIEHLSAGEGEKHLIFVSQQPMFLGRIPERPSEHRLVKLATTARVTLHFLNTGGLPGFGMKNGQLIIRKPSAEFLNIDIRQAFAARDHRRLAEQTGGTSAFYTYADEPLATIDRITRCQYLLGYYPTGKKPVAMHRVIEVAVNRPDVTVLHRHAY